MHQNVWVIIFFLPSKIVVSCKMAVKYIVVVMRPLRAAADGGCPHVLILPVGGE